MHTLMHRIPVHPGFRLLRRGWSGLEAAAPGHHVSCHLGHFADRGGPVGAGQVVGRLPAGTARARICGTRYA